MEHEAQESWVSLGEALGNVLASIERKVGAQEVSAPTVDRRGRLIGELVAAGWGELPGSMTADGSRPAARFDALRRIRPCDYACPPAGFRSPQAVLN